MVYYYTSTHVLYLIFIHQNTLRFVDKVLPFINIPWFTRFPGFNKFLIVANTLKTLQTFYTKDFPLGIFQFESRLLLTLNVLLVRILRLDISKIMILFNWWWEYVSILCLKLEITLKKRIRHFGDWTHTSNGPVNAYQQWSSERKKTSRWPANLFDNLLPGF